MQDFREEGEGVTRRLIRELQAIHTRQELVEATPKLKRLFIELIDIIISAQEFRLSHSVADENHDDDNALSDALQIELRRLYALEGGREILEKCEEDALNKLDAFEKQRSRKF